MSDFLKLFSSMSGMQKSFLTLDEANRNRTAADKEATIANLREQLKTISADIQALLKDKDLTKEPKEGEDRSAYEAKNKEYAEKSREYRAIGDYIKRLGGKLEKQEAFERSAVLSRVAKAAAQKPRLSPAAAAWKTLSLANITGADQVSSKELEARKSRILLRQQQLSNKLGNPSLAEVVKKLDIIQKEIDDTEAHVDYTTKVYIETRRAAKALSTKEEVTDALQAASKEFARPLAVAKRRVADLKKAQASWYELQDLLEINPETGKNKIEAALAALDAEDPDERADSFGATLQKDRRDNAVAKAMGLSKRQRALLSVEKLGLADSASLVYKEKPSLVAKVLSFDDMLVNAINATVENPEVQIFKAAIDNCNRLYSNIFRHVQTMAAYNVVAKADKNVKKVFDKLAGGGRIEVDPDLVKICWLFFAGNDTLERAKANPAFIKAIENLEKSKPVNSITFPISQITSVDNIFKSEQVKQLFEAINTKVLHEEDHTRTSNYVDNIIDGPSVIYDGTNSTTAENIADTLYYAIVNVFGTPSDKLKLLKLAGTGSTTRFLTEEAKKQIRKEQIAFEDFYIGKRPLGSKGRKEGKGDKTKLGKKIISMVKAIKPSKNSITMTEPIVSKKVEDLVNRAVSIAMDFSKSTQITKVIVDAFVSGTTPENLTSLLSGKFNEVVGLLENNRDAISAKKEPEKFAEFSQAVKLTKAEFQNILAKISTLQQEDIDKLASVFQASSKEKPVLEKDVVIKSASPEGETLLSYVKSIIQACDEYREDINADLAKKNAPVTYEVHSLEPDEKGFELMKEFEIEQAEEELTFLNKELSDLQDSLASNKRSTKIKQEIKDITKEIASAQAKLDEAKTSVYEEKPKVFRQAGQGPTKKISFADSSILRSGETAKEKLLDFQKRATNENIEEPDFNAGELFDLIETIPEEILGYDYISPVIKDSAIGVFDTLLDTSDNYTATVAWCDEVKTALVKLSKYMAAPSLKTKKDRYTAMSIMIDPFRSKLEDQTRLATLTKAERKKIAKLSDKAKEKRDLLTISGIHGEQTGNEKIDAAQIKETLRNVSIVPGTAFAGNPAIKEKTLIGHYLRSNLMSLEENASIFYVKILEAIKELKLVDKVLKDEPISTTSPAVAGALLSLIATFKANLSSDIKSVDTENEIFLDTLVSRNELSLVPVETDAGKYRSRAKTSISTKELLEFLRGSMQFVRLVDIINQTQEVGAMAWPTAVINAPIIGIGTGSSTLGLKTASLLNIIGGLKNFDSLSSFDLSSNRSNKDILSSILNTNRYPTIFSDSITTTLIMKIYFLSQLCKGIKSANIVDKFKENFINVKVSAEGKLADKIKTHLEDLNKTLQDTIVAELEKDLGENGTLVTELNTTIELLENVAIGNSVYIINKSYRPVLEQLPETNIEAFAVKVGEAMSPMFLALQSSNKATQNFIYLLSADADTEKSLANTIKNCVEIVKAGINYHCGYEIVKTLANFELYDPDTRRVPPAKLQARLDEYKKNPEFVQFTEKFITSEAVDEEGNKIENEFVTKKASASTEGFSNLENGYLKAFLYGFTWDSLTKFLVDYDLEEYKSETSDEAAIARIEANKELQSESDVFIDGLFRRNASTSPSLTSLKQNLALYKKQLIVAKDEDDENAISTIQAKIDNCQKAIDETSLTFKAKGSKKAGPKDDINIEKTPAGKTEILIKAVRDDGYSNITREMILGHKEGMVTGERKTSSQEGGKKSIINLKGVKTIITDFAASLVTISKSLSLAYSRDTVIKAAIEDYARTVSNSSVHLKAAIDALSETVFSTEAQTLALDSLLKITTTEIPPGVPILLDPDKAKKYSIDLFNEDGPFEDIYTFAMSASNDIIRHNISMGDIYSAINDIITEKGSEEDFLSKTDLPKSLANSDDASAAVQTKTSEKVAIDLPHAIATFFSEPSNDSPDKDAQHPATTTLNRLYLSVKGLTNPVEVEKEIKELKASREPIDKAMEALRAGMAPFQSTLKNQDAAFLAELAKENLSPEEVKRRTDSYNRDRDKLNPIPAEILAARKELGKLWEEAKDINIKIEELENSTGSRKPQIVLFLEKVFLAGEVQFNHYKSFLKTTNDPKNKQPENVKARNKASRSQRELLPIQNRTRIVINFIRDLIATSGNSTQANAILAKFEALHTASLGYEVFKENNALTAKTRFVLLEAADFVFIDENDYPDDPKKLNEYAKAASEKAQELKDYLKSTQMEIDGILVSSLSTVEVEKLKSEIGLFARAASKSAAAFDELKSKFILKNKDYISEIAKYLILNKKCSTAEEFRVPLPDPDSTIGDTYVGEGIEESVRAALTLNLIKKDKIFSGYRLGLSSDVKLGITYKDEADNRVSVKLPIVGLFSIKMFAERNMDYIDFYEI